MPKDFKLLSILAKGFRGPDGKLNWKVTASAIYAVVVWSTIGVVVTAYKMGYIEIKESKAGDEIEETPIMDKRERTRILYEDIAENVYTSETFVG